MKSGFFIFVQMNSKPIGIFDSGVGGTSIFKEIEALLPNEHTIYLADSKNTPYGNKTKKEIIDFSIKNTDLLISKNCKLIVVACNTATTIAIQTLRDRYNIPFIGIEPAIKPAALNTQTKAIGILATKGTLASDLFHETTNLYSNEIDVIEQEGEGIVSLIENGEVASHKMRSLLQLYLQPMIDANIDYLVLGCTHYPYLMPLLLELLPKYVKIIDSGQAVAKQVEFILDQQNLANTLVTNVKHQFFINTHIDVMSSLMDDQYKVEILDF